MQAKKLYIVIPFVVLVLVISFTLACNGGSAAAEKEEVKEKTKEEIEKIQPPDKFNCGDEIVFYDPKTDNPICSLIIHSVENYTEYSQSDAPDEGMRYIAIDVEIKNLSEEVQRCDSWYNYALRDADNYVYGNIYGGIPKDPRLNSGDIVSGDTIRGWITFSDVPEDVEIIEILAETCSCSPPAIIVIKDPIYK